MIALTLAAVLAQQQMPDPVVLTEMSAPIVTFQTVVKFPELGPRDRAALAVLAEILPEETRDFTPGRVRLIVFGSGDQVRAIPKPDHLQISFSVPSADKSLGFSLLESILLRPRLEQENVERAKSSLARKTPSPWMAALQPVAPPVAKVSLKDVVDLSKRLFRPENITVGIGGPVTPAEAGDQWDRRFGEWVPPRLGPWPKDYSDAPMRIPIKGNYKVQVIAGDPFVVSDAASPTKILALFALGVGKDSTLFRIVREKLALSYRQEVVLVPTAKGLEPRILLAQSMDAAPGAAEAAIKAIKEDVNAWTEDTLARANAMAVAVYERGLELDPIALGAFGNLSQSLADRTFLAAYWQSKTGQPWVPQAMLGRMKAVTLADLKDAATQMLDKARIEVID